MKDLSIMILILIGLMIVLYIIGVAAIFITKIWQHVNVPHESLESLKTAIVERDIQQCIFTGDKDLIWDISDLEKLPKGYYRDCNIKFYLGEKP